MVVLSGLQAGKLYILTVLRAATAQYREKEQIHHSIQPALAYEGDSLLFKLKQVSQDAEGSLHLFMWHKTKRLARLATIAL